MNTKLTIKRKYFKQLIEERDRPEVSILIGPRQVGKTTLLKELGHYFSNNNERVLYLNLENPLDLQKLPQKESELIKWLMDYHILLIDELYYIKNVSRIFKILVDAGHENKIKIYASGSSATDIHTHIEESLAGRRLITQIFPLTFSEFKTAFSTKSESEIFEEFLIFGGLPGLLHVHQDEKPRLLREMLETYIQKDIKSLVKEENIRAYNQLLVLLAQQQGQLVSVNSLSKDLSLNAATVEKYLTILEKTYCIYRIHSYARNLANELKKSQKIYFYDSGIRHIILQNFSQLSERQNIGFLLESFVLTEMLPNCPPQAQIRFWRTRNQQELDFIIVYNQVPYPIEVKKDYQPNFQKTLTNFKSFFKNYPETPFGTIVSQKTGEPILNKDPEIRLRSFFESENLILKNYLLDL